MSAHKISLAGYDYNGANNIRNASAKTATGSKDSFSAIVGHNQGTVTQAELSIGAYTTNAQSSEELEEMVKLQTAGNDANSVYYGGTSYFPLGLGQTISIINQTVEHELVVIEVSHLSQVHGNYSCNFKAIPADVAAPHYTDVHVFAKAETQPAKVMDNNDPEGLGRVKVKYNWASGSTTSDWMRMIQPHTGAGKGFYFIPEIDEEVLVGFEGGNAQSPYVLGAQYNGSESSGYADSQNNVKAIHTRSGTKIILNDAEGSILIEDPSGNTYLMDGQGNIEVNAPKNLTFNAGDNVSITAGKNVTVSAGGNITSSAAMNMIDSAGININQIASADFMLMAKNITKIASDNYSADAKDISRNASGKIEAISVDEHIQNSKGKVENLSGEKSINA